MTSNCKNGLVTRLQAGFYTVWTDEGEVTCRLRGRFKKEAADWDICVVGDKVKISLLDDGSGVIESIEEREKVFVRMAPTARGITRQVMLANPDQVILVFACANPVPSLRMLDRFLVIAESQQITAVILANKYDLVSPEQARATFDIYETLGYPLIFTSAKKDLNINPLRAVLRNKVSALAGPSGVGKSSLLNKVQPGLGLQIGGLKKGSSKGRHTTVVRELLKLDEGGFVADMPGLRTLSFWDIQPEELDGYFPELRSLVSNCQFNNCSHINEPGCAVIQAVQEGKVNENRYESYVRLRAGD